MVKMVICIRRRPEISAAEFRRYWLEEHGTKVRQLAPEMGIRRYVQSHTLVEDELLGAQAREPRGSAPPFDGIAELWWDGLDVLQAAATSPEAEQVHRLLIEDEARFVDLSQSTVFFTEEHEVVPMTASPRP